MKKLAIAAAAAASLTAGVANAYTVGTFSNGFVVPNVIHDASGTTAVGLVNQSGQSVAVYWTFFDQNSTHITDGCFNMTNKDYEPFIWSSQAGTGTTGKRGYLVFAAGSATYGSAPATACGAVTGTVYLAGTAAQISGNAFQVDLAAKSVAFTPVIDGALTINTTHDITRMDASSLQLVAGAATVDAGTSPMFSMRYAIDGVAGGTDTRIVVWSTGDQKKSHTVDIYNNAQQRKSVNFDLTYSELDYFDPEVIVGRPADFLDGFIEWQPNLASFATAGVTMATTTVSVVTYSIISAPAFGAVQTILGSHK